MSLFRQARDLSAEGLQEVTAVKKHRGEKKKAWMEYKGKGLALKGPLLVCVLLFSHSRMCVFLFCFLPTPI